MKSMLKGALGLAGLAVLTAADTASLPLDRGVYAEVGLSCHGADSARRSWFGGGYVIQAPHAHCELKSSAQIGAADYRIALRCFEYGDRSKPYEVVNKVTIVSPREYRMENRFGRFHARWCHD